MNLFYKTGTRVQLVGKGIVLTGTVLLHDDDSNTQIGNVEECITIKTDDGKVYTFQGKDALRPRAKSLRKYGHFYIKSAL